MAEVRYVPLELQDQRDLNDQFFALLRHGDPAIVRRGRDLLGALLRLALLPEDTDVLAAKAMMTDPEVSPEVQRTVDAMLSNIFARRRPES